VILESLQQGFVQKASKCARYAFCGWLALCLTESQSWLLVFVMGKLRNPRRERFAVEVASMVPVDRAYLAAGFRSKPEWARPNGSKLAHVTEVAVRIAELRSEFTENSRLSVEYLQAKLLPAAEANAVDFFTKEGKLKSIDAITRDQGAAISTIKFHEDGTVAELRLIPKEAAVATLLRSVGAVVEHHAHLHVGADHADRFAVARNEYATTLAALSIEDQRILLDKINEELRTGEATEADASE
jgi:hypothetical protein